MVCQHDGPREFKHFLSKFDILDKVDWNRDSLVNSLSQVHWDIVKERIDYSELHFTIGKYIRNGWDAIEVIQLIRAQLDSLDNVWGCKTGLVLSLKYESPRSEQEFIASLIERPEVAECVVGIDLVGDESYFDVGFYKPIFEVWKRHNKGLEAHVGETGPVENVRDAILEMGVHRIAHGIKIVQDDDLVHESIRRGVCFDVALSSNYFTGVVESIEDHPIKDMIEKGCIVTLGTDDPIQYDSSLDFEYMLLMSTFGYSAIDMNPLMDNSIKYCFDPSIKDNLRMEDQYVSAQSKDNKS